MFSSPPGGWKVVRVTSCTGDKVSGDKWQVTRCAGDKLRVTNCAGDKVSGDKLSGDKCQWTLNHNLFMTLHCTWILRWMCNKLLVQFPCQTHQFSRLKTARWLHGSGMQVALGQLDFTYTPILGSGSKVFFKVFLRSFKWVFWWFWVIVLILGGFFFYQVILKLQLFWDPSHLSY